ncbi:MAG: restriction endonuclease subunit S, partial [Methylococcaceae bacterium]|nr:restriction endonuclease subunit S [Methylococcaceae bacterium]
RTSETIDEIGLSSTCLATIEDASFAGFLIRFRPKSNMIDADFSKYYFRNSLLRAFFIKEMNLVTRASLSQDLLKKLPVTLPPLEEQKQIAEFLNHKTSIFLKLIKNAELAIELMKERRTALISAAVTGKIDLRNWQA